MPKKLLVQVSLSVVVVLVVAAVSLVTTTGMWIGQFTSGDYEFFFAEPNGTPVKGVQLEVTDKDGNKVYEFVVREYLENNTPESDDKGLLKFHGNSMRFGGTCWHLFWLIPVGTCDSPVFYVRFLYRGKEVEKHEYGELSQQLQKPGGTLRMNVTMSKE
jgi:hypothetical protein